MNKHLKKLIKKAFLAALSIFPIGRIIRETEGTQTPVKPSYFFWQKILGFNRHCYWPVHFTSIVSNPRNILCGIETCPGFMPGCYIQAHGKISIGDYTQISANVGIITSNHDIHSNVEHLPPKDISIGEYCWIGMNVTILPGVTLGNFTTVGAGSVVTKSFPDGYCVVAGNPAQIIRRLNPEQCRPFKSKHEYNGYIKSTRFDTFRKEKLNV